MYDYLAVDRMIEATDKTIARLDREAFVKLNEGLGGVYERIAYSNVIKRIAESRGARSLLELQATYIAGIPGFNSVLLARDGFDVTITVHPRDYEDALHAWGMLGLLEKVKIVEWPDGTMTEFEDGQFDLVWNHLAFEHYQDPAQLVNEMARISKDVVMNLTLSPWNIGFGLHWLGHKILRKPWDHGFFRHTTIGAMERAHREVWLQHLESGGCDMPPWMDTVDAQMGGSMTYFDAYGRAGERWVWCSADPRCKDHWMVRLFWGWEKAVPEWFRRAVAHHLYVASVKR